MPSHVIEPEIKKSLISNEIKYLSKKYFINQPPPGRIWSKGECINCDDDGWKKFNIFLRNYFESIQKWSHEVAVRAEEIIEEFREILFLCIIEKGNYNPERKKRYVCTAGFICWTITEYFPEEI